MNTRTMRVVDFWVGRCLCAALTLLRRTFALARVERSAKDPLKRILFIKLIEQGATVLACGAFRRAQQMVGRENVYICVFEKNREILDILELFPPGNILTIRTKSIFRLARDVMRVLVRVRRLGIDASIDMEFFTRGSAILSFLCGGTRRVGMHGFRDEAPYRGDLMTHRVHYNPYVHTSHAFSLLVEALNRNPEETPILKVHPELEEPLIPAFEPVEADVARVQDMLRQRLEGEIPRPIIVLNPNSSDPLRMRKWPEERYVELGKRVVEEHPGAAIVLVGLASERTAAQRIRKAMGAPGAVSLAGQTTLRELVTLFTFADVLVTNDSGPAHFASITPIHQVVLFGPETPALFGPLGERTRVIYKQLACSPCLSAYNHRFSPCRDNVCIHSVTVDEVYDLVRACLEERGERDSRVKDERD